MVDRPAWSREVFFALISVLGLSRQSIAFSSSSNDIGLETYRLYEQIVDVVIAQKGRSTKPHPWELGDIALQLSVGIGVLPHL